MKHTKLIATLLATAIVASLCQPTVDTSAASIKLSKSKIKLTQGKTTTLKVKGTKEKAKWSIKSGKKCIKMQKKRKASVKIKALKVGTAKIQCKIGKKKLVCKVTVKAKNKEQIPQPTSQATIPPTLVPMSTPSQTIEPTGLPIRTHAPTEDQLMVEPAQFTFIPTSDENGLPIDCVGGPQRYYFFGTEIQRNQIEDVRFSDKIEIPENALGTFDLSEKQNGSVMCWYMDQDADKLYEIVIAQEGGVVANPNSSYLLCEVGGVSGLEHLYTSEVTNMSYMFYQYRVDFGTMSYPEITLDLGNSFDTSNVENMKCMFWEFAPMQKSHIYLGAAFCVDKVTNAACAFAPKMWADTRFYVCSEELKKWIIAPENNCAISEAWVLVVGDNGVLEN